MAGSHIRAVTFDCFGTLLRIGAPTNSWHSLLSEARQQPGGRTLDPRREPIPTIEAFAAACAIGFRLEWWRDLDRELASIEPMLEALAVLDRLRAAGFRLAFPFPGRTVVVTHHCPHPGLISERREDLDPAYGSNLLPIIERVQPDAWLFGHTHVRAGAEVGRTLVCNVSLGYPHEVKPGTEADILLRGFMEERRS